MKATTRMILRLGAIGLCVAALAFVAFRTSSAQHTPANADSAAMPPVPAVTAKATRQDVPIYATGIGTVQAYQSVLVRARRCRSVTRPTSWRWFRMACQVASRLWSTDSPACRPVPKWQSPVRRCPADE
jgi:hypothetical protein